MKPWTQCSRTDANFAPYLSAGYTRPEATGNLAQTHGSHIAISKEREGCVCGTTGLVSCDSLKISCESDLVVGFAGPCLS